MTAHRSRSVLLTAPTATVAAASLTACRPGTTDVSPRDPAAEPRSGGGAVPLDVGGCPEPGARTGAVLPAVDGYRAIDNPCLAFLDLATQVTALVPPGADRRQAATFIGNVGRFADRLGQVNDVAECAYQTDRLAVRIYHSRENRWSVGLAAVVRGRLGAVADTALCFLIEQAAILGLRIRGAAPDADQASYCFNTTRQRRGGEDYTIIWMGSSIRICNEFQDRFVPGDGRLVAVQAKPTVALRRGPSTSDQAIRRVPDGTLGRAICGTTGESVNGYDLWIRTDIVGDRGYIAVAHLDSALPLGGLDECPR
ncbi:hypothetical protein ACTMSW_26215 [Micromonospora sp. BQ11]|uniref:hypothetical protein n=1 Tax=Micromonospora sp. BQ11 TaxID=3452212 RepID=UPI003F8C1EB2